MKNIKEYFCMEKIRIEKKSCEYKEKISEN